jgi:signal transduction histidine kinase
MSIIGWRTGIGGALIGIFGMFLGTILGFNLHPDFTQYRSLAGPLIGTFLHLTLGIISGYVSTLVHSLKKEIKLRKSIQKELEKRNKELDSFGHTVAHDLKNFLTILSMTQISLSSQLNGIKNAKVTKYLNYIKDNSIKMGNLIEDILLLAGITKNKTIELKPLSTEEIIEESLKRLQFLIKEKNAKIHMPQSYPHLVGYPPWIIQMYVNFISNAIKYGGNPEKEIEPEIWIGFGTDSNKEHTGIRCWVKDNGAGIKPEIAGLMFKEFNRYDIKRADGHGLGLSIVKLIAEKLGGSVGVESEVGKGSLFYFDLPTSPSKTQVKIEAP